MNRLPALRLFALALLSLLGAIAMGILGAVVAVYLYDRGTSKGNDLAVSMIGFHAVGTFTFTSLLTFLWTRSGNVSWKIPVSSLAACLFALFCTTILFASGYDEYFAIFFVIGWISVAFSGALALGFCKYILWRARAARCDDSIENS